jgi:hypothetical protein
MAKTRMTGIMGHQGGYDPAGVDPEMKRTLQGGDEPKAPAPAPKPAPENPIQTAVRAVSQFMRGGMNSTGSKRSPSTRSDMKHPDHPSFTPAEQDTILSGRRLTPPGRKGT